MAKFTYYAVFVLYLQLVQCAPKTKTATTYDQKQTGEYNIQLHLKDFQIIAVVGEDSLGSLSGDYDYNYDYSDFTIKPVTPTTTKKPDENQTVSTQTPLLTTTKKNISHPYPLIHPETTSQATPTTQKIATNAVEFVELQVTTQKTQKVTAVTEKENGTTPEKTPPSHISSHIAGQIPVIVQDYSEHDTPNVILLKDGNSDKKIEAVTNIAIVPSEDLGSEQQEQPTLGEILHYRRCAQGYARDKRGRCRKVRRPPQIPLGITRLASNLAAKFRQSAMPEFESLEPSKEN